MIGQKEEKNYWNITPSEYWKGCAEFNLTVKFHWKNFEELEK